jgi:excisionase family DNA binding protein
VWIIALVTYSTPSDEVLTAVEAAALLRVKPSTVGDWARQGIIPSFKLGRFRRYSRRAIEGHVAALATPNPYR